MSSLQRRANAPRALLSGASLGLYALERRPAGLNDAVPSRLELGLGAANHQVSVYGVPSAPRDDHTSSPRWSM